MALVLAFGIVLLISVSLSGIAARTVFSTALLCLALGALVGPGGLGLIPLTAQDDIVSVLADIAMFAVLFTDGQRANVRALRENWRLSGRALGLGMPLTMIGIAVPAHYLCNLDWPTAFLLGAILSPTDPVFASALVGRPDVPLRLRRLLNVESGLNDGLALPFVLIFLAFAKHEDSHLGVVLLELVLGVIVGAGVAAIVALAWRSRFLTAEPHLQPLGPLAIAVVVYAVCHLSHANPYLAAFAAGSTLATLDHVAAEHFEPLGDLLSEITKFAALLVFGTLITPERISHLGWPEWLLAIIAIVLVRPASMLLSLIRTPMPAAERWTAAWFGPKGFASVVYGLLVLRADIPEAERLFDLIAITITLSIALHSSTDVLIARRLRIDPPDHLPSGHADLPEMQEPAQGKSM